MRNPFKKRVPFNDFINAIEDLELVMKYTTPLAEVLGVKVDDITYLKYETLKYEIPAHFEQSQFDEALHLALREKSSEITFKNVVRLDNYKKFRFLVHIKACYRQIEELERRYLSSPPDHRLIRLGIKKLDVLGDKNIIDTLAQGDILKWEKVIKLPYAQIFDKQLMLSIHSSIAKKDREEQEMQARNNRNR